MYIFRKQPSTPDAAVLYFFIAYCIWQYFLTYWLYQDTPATLSLNNAFQFFPLIFKIQCPTKDIYSTSLLGFVRVSNQQPPTPGRADILAPTHQGGHEPERSW